VARSVLLSEILNAGKNMNPEVDLEGADILESEERAYTTKQGAAATARTVVFKYGGKIFKLPVDKKCEMQKVVAKHNKKATITLEMSTFGDSIAPDFRVVDVS